MATELQQRAAYREGYLDIRAISPRLAGPQGADRGFIAGRSGSGKSVLARALLGSYGWEEPAAFRGGVLCIDPNHNFDLEGAVVTSRLRELLPTRERPKVVYRPSVGAREAEDWNGLLREVFYHPQPLMTYVDETYALESLFLPRKLEGGNMLRALLTQGRARGKAVLMAAQQPVNIPRNVIAQAEYFYVFDLPVEDDRATIAGSIGRFSAPSEKHPQGQDIRDRESLMRYEFWFRGPKQVRPVRLKVRL